MQFWDAQLLRQPNCPKPKRHNAKLCRFTVRQQIVNALANGDSKRAIARGLRVSNNTVTAIAEQEWQQVEARKQRIVAQCERNATLAADQLSERLETEELSAKLDAIAAKLKQAQTPKLLA